MSEQKHGELHEIRWWEDAPVVSPGDLRARIEQLEKPGRLFFPNPYENGWDDALEAVLALLGAAQEQP